MSLENVVSAQAIEWGMQERDGSVSAQAIADAREYMQYLEYGSNFAVQLMFAYTLNATQGVMLVCSTPESCVLDNENCRRIAQNLAVLQVGWMKFSVWWYPGLSILNFYGMTDRSATGGVLLGTVEHVFGEEWFRRNEPTWQIKYGIPRPGGEYYDMLFCMLHALGIPFFVLITSGYSWRGYRALDVYLRPFVYGQPPPAMEAWYLVNLEKPWYHRAFLKCDDWYQCRHWVSFGQRAALLNHVIHQKYSILPPASRM